MLWTFGVVLKAEIQSVKCQKKHFSVSFFVFLSEKAFFYQNKLYSVRKMVFLIDKGFF